LDADYYSPITSIRYWSIRKDYAMKRQDFAIAALWTVVLAVTVIAAIYSIRFAADAAAKTMVSIIGAAGVLLGAILTHALAAFREQQLELQKQRQINYAALIEKMAPFVRAPKSQIDIFTTAHLYSWVVGSPAVVEMTAEFIKNRSESNLKSLLLEMRKDVGLPKIEGSIEGVFAPKEPEGSLNPN
jgi:hypothetical protein